MKKVNARVWECGMPRLAYYMGTYTDGSKHYMEIRYGQRQSRKWVPVDKVILNPDVSLQYCEKVTELVKA